MINFHLLKKELKSNSKIWILFLLIITMYSMIIVSMYDPEFSQILQTLVDSTPELLAAFGFSNTPTDLVSFVVNYLYGFIVIVIPLIFTIVLSYRLVGKYVDNGSMAYLLTTPYSRKQVLSTQITTLFIYISMFILYIFLVVSIVSFVLFPGDLVVSKFAIINIGLFTLHIFLASVTLLCSTIFDDSKKILSSMSAFAIGSILLQMLSQVDETISFLKYFTPLTLFSTTDLLAENFIGYVYCIVLFILSIILFKVSIVIFCKKDLPL